MNNKKRTKNPFISMNNIGSVSKYILITDVSLL